MRTHQIQVSNGRETVREIRRQLFEFPEVLEVFDTGRADVLVVVYAGHPRPGEWLAALRAVGYEVQTRRLSPRWNANSTCLLRDVRVSHERGSPR